MNHEAVRWHHKLEFPVSVFRGGIFMLTSYVSFRLIKEKCDFWAGVVLKKPEGLRPPIHFHPDLYMEKQSICSDCNSCKWARTITLVGTASHCLTGMQISQTGTNVQFIAVYGKPGCYKASPPSQEKRQYRSKIQPAKATYIWVTDFT